jgi:drug/metabolite transporter (DMT)-like permease
MRHAARHAAYLAFALLGVIWGTSFIFTKWAAVWITPGQIVLLRVLFGFAPVLVAARASRSLRWWHLRHAHHFLVMALLATVIYYFAFAKGTALLLSSVAGMLSGAIPLFSFLAALLFLREEPLNRRCIAGMLMGFIGVLLAARPWTSGASQVGLAGVLYMLGGAFSVGCSFVYARKFLSPLGIPPVALCCYQIGTALVLLLLITDMHGATRILSDRHAAVGLALGLGLMGTGIAYILYYFIVQHLGAMAAAGVTYIPPVVALFIGCVLASEPLRALDVVAIAAILLGVFILQSARKGGAVQGSAPDAASTS